jgi:predicted nucleic acid-binding protein
LPWDDQDVRSVARRHGVPTTGTLGVLALGVRQGLLSKNEANALLKEMIAAGYRSPVTELDSLLSQ